MRTDGQTDMAKLTGAFRDYAKVLLAKLCVFTSRNTRL